MFCKGNSGGLETQQQLNVHLYYRDSMCVYYRLNATLPQNEFKLIFTIKYWEVIYADADYR